MITLLFGIVITLYISLAILLNILKSKNNKNKFKIAFFHPFCNDGGGGQKVLWCIISSILTAKQKPNNIQLAVYSLNDNKQEIIEKTKNRFSIDLIKYKDEIKIIYVPGRKLLIPQKKLTMVFHLISPMIYALNCLFKYQPDIFYDTTGFSSTLFLTKILIPTTQTASYVHYPFISMDMIKKVKQRKSDFNNDQSISKSPLKTQLKLFYYQSIYILYKLNGYFVNFAQTNSTWTHEHMRKIWKNLDDKNKLTKLYPPCSVQQLLKYQKKTQSSEVLIMSLAQFRPQKNHKCQINTMKKIVDHINQNELQIQPKLYICGTTRGKDDEQILQSLKNMTKQLQLQKYIQFQVNKSFSEIQKYFQKALIGIHTMQAQHFGISVVEMLAAGLIVVAHNSAGPKFDIVQDQNFLADSENDYFSKIINILKSSSEQKQKWIKQNRQKASKFGQLAFQQQLLQCLDQYSSLKFKSK